MRKLRSYWFLGLAGLVVLAAVAAVRPEEDARPAYACTGGPSHLESYADQAQYVAIVEVIEVGGPDNPAPSVTPMATPPGWSMTPTPVGFDLTGVGATVRVVEDLLGDAPLQFEIDQGVRASTEAQIRDREANPWRLSSCELGWGVTKYEVGDRFLVVAGAYPGTTETAAILRYPVEGDSITIGSNTPHGIGTNLLVTAATYDAYFAGVPYASGGSNDRGVEFRHVMGPVPLHQMRAAIRGIFLGQAPPPTSPSELPSLEDLACQPSLLQASAGDKIVMGNLAVTLPASGNYAYGPLVMDPGGVALRICQVETQSVITLSDATGEEISRSGTDPFGQQVLDQIAAGVQPATTVGRITPPDTGNAGLR